MDLPSAQEDRPENDRMFGRNVPAEWYVSRNPPDFRSNRTMCYCPMHAATYRQRGIAVRFSHLAPTAHDVSLVGTFNDWDPNVTPMERQPAGEWSVTVDLPSGRYQYLYVVDGHLCGDPECDGLTQIVFERGRRSDSREGNCVRSDTAA